MKNNTLDEIDNNIVKALLYGVHSPDETQNTSILNATIEFLTASNHFEEQLY